MFFALVWCLQFRGMFARVEVGRLSLEGTDVSGNGIPARVSFEEELTDPVVIATVVTHNDPRPATCRIASLSSTGFDLVLESTEKVSERPNHPAEEASYFAVDTSQLLSNMQAGKLTVSDTNWHSVAFGSVFTGTPALLAFIQTKNNERVNIRVRNVGSAGFDIKLDNLEDDVINNPEVLGWVAISEGVHDLGLRSEFGIITGVNQNRKDITTTESFVDPKVFVATINTFAGADSVYPRGYQSNSDNQISVRGEETQILSEDQGHASEVVSWAAFYTCCYTYNTFQTFCATGFSKGPRNCTLELSPVFQLTLDQIEDTVQEQAQGIKVYTGEDSSFYPDYKTSDPLAAYKRGYYFTGSSYMRFPEVSESKFTFAPYFTVTAWVRPDSNSNYEVLLSKVSESPTQSTLEFRFRLWQP